MLLLGNWCKYKIMSFDATEIIRESSDNRRNEIYEAVKELRDFPENYNVLPYKYLNAIRTTMASSPELTTGNKQLLKFLALFIQADDECLDPWAYPGSFSSIYTKGKWSGFSKNQEAFDDWTRLTSGTEHNKTNKYDVVVGFIPFGLRNNVYDSKDRYRYFSSHFLSNIKNGLHENSKVLIVSTKNELDHFIKHHQKESELKIKAILSLPEYSWTQTGMQTYLLWLELGEQDDYFVGELSDDPGRAQSIYKSIELGGNKNITTGYKVSSKRIGITCHEIIKEQSLTRFSKKNGWEVITLKELSNPEVNTNLAFVFQKGQALNTEKPIKISIVPDDIAELKKDKKKLRYSFLSIDESKLNLEFFKYYCEKSNPVFLGKNSNDLKLALPSIDEQKRIVDCASKVGSLQNLLKETELALFNHGQKLEGLENRVKDLTSHENLSFWISSLPFPVSSILRIYLAEDRPDKQVEALLYFFEALTQFIAIVTVSMLSSNENTLGVFKPSWVEKDKSREDWYKRASFGDWIALGRRLRKAVAKEFTFEDSYNQYSEILGNPSLSFIDLISSKELYTLLDEANMKRNQWKGHGGITSDEENIERSKYLRRILEKLRALSQGALQEIRVLKPVGSNYKKGVYTTSVEVLRGNETPFEKDKIESDIPLDEDELYLNIGNYNSPYLLLPFVRYKPDTKAVYFYSRLNNETKTHWVTYNFPEVSSLDIDIDENFNDALSKFMNP
mgnify:CR=1 FL=1